MTSEAQYPKDFELPIKQIPKAEPMFQVERKHNHYFKDVSKLQVVDVYRVIDLFGVKDPCIQHALKKLLVSGGRGVKDMDRDVQEAIDTLQRFQEMRREDGHE